MEVITHASAEDLSLTPATEDDGRSIARRLPVERALVALSELAHRVEADDDDRAAHVVTATRLFAGTRTWGRVRNVLERSTLFMFGTPQVHDAIRLVLLFGEGDPALAEPAFRELLADLVIATLGTTDPEAASGTDLDEENILPSWIAMHAEQGRTDVGTTLALRTRELNAMGRVVERHGGGEGAAELISRKVDVEKEILAVAMAAHVVSHQRPSPHLQIGETTFAEDFRPYWRAIRESLVATVEEFREDVRDARRPAMLEALRRKPLLHREGGDALILAPLPLTWWMTEGIRDRMEADLVEIPGVWAAPWVLRGEAAERALVEWVSELDPTRLCCSDLVVSGETEYRRDGRRVDSADLHLACPHGIVVVELHSGRAPLDPAGPSERGLEVAAEKPGQLVRPIADLRDGRYPVGGYVPGTPIRAVVIDDRVPVENAQAPRLVVDVLDRAAACLRVSGARSLNVMEMADWVRLVGKVEGSSVWTVHSALRALSELKGVRPGLGLGGPLQYEGDLFDADGWSRPSSLERDVPGLTDAATALLFPNGPAADVG